MNGACFAPLREWWGFIFMEKGKNVSDFSSCWVSLWSYVMGVGSGGGDVF
jgi:hypothetical protein